MDVQVDQVCTLLFFMMKITLITEQITRKGNSLNLFLQNVSSNSTHWLMPQSPGFQISLGNTFAVSCPVINFMGKL